MINKICRLFNIPILDDESELKFYSYIFYANLIRSYYLYACVVLVSSLLFTNFVICYVKTKQVHYLISSSLSLLIILLIFLFIYIVRFYIKNPLKQNKKNFILFILPHNLTLLFLPLLISILENNPFMFLVFILLVSVILFLSPITIVIQYSLLLFSYFLLSLFLFEFSLLNGYPTILTIAFSAIVSFVVFVNKLTEFQLFSGVHERNRMLRKSNQVLSEFSYSDALTGVNNRRRIEDILKDNWKYCKANNKNLSVIFIDIDNFKHFNDTYGHVEGDACLVQVANAINDLCEMFFSTHSSTMGRYGGEEFIIILPRSDKESVLNFGKLVCNKIEALNIPHKDNEELNYVTISCGATTMIPDDEKRILYILETADRALYYVKRNGKNNIFHFSDL